MPSRYRFGAWLVEMLTEALSFYIVASVMSHSDKPSTVRDIAAVMIEILTFFVVSGYAVTTLVIRLALRGKWGYVYPAIVPLLFLAHFEVMNLWVPGGLMDSQNRLVFRVVGSVVVLVVATAISLVLERLGKRGQPPMSRASPSV